MTSERTVPALDPSPRTPWSIAAASTCILGGFLTLALLAAWAAPTPDPPAILDSVAVYLAPALFGLGVVGGLAARSLTSAEKIELERRGSTIVSNAHPDLTIGDDPAVVVSQAIWSRPSSTGSRQQNRQTGVSLYWLPAGREKHGPNSDGEAIETWCQREGQILAERIADRHRARSFAEGLCKIADADLVWVKQDVVDVRPREALDQSLSERLRDRDLEPSPDLERLGLALDRTDGESRLLWKPSRRGSFGLEFGAVGSFCLTLLTVAIVVQFGWTPLGRKLLGGAAGLVTFTGFAAWGWRQLRTHEVEITPDGITIHDALGPLWSRSRHLPADTLEEIVWDPSPRQGARLWAIGDEFVEPLGRRMRGSRAIDIQTALYHVFAPQGEWT